ncbi:MAG: hypothetical protein FJ387_12475 [Verrucomicrobia bacterium]|nr:hypothetical protein [Verrucomicrobiota bacterium]
MKPRTLRLCAALTFLPLAVLVGYADLKDTLAAAARYESGLDVAPHRELERLVAQAIGNAALRQQLEAGLAAQLTEPATFEGQRFICQQLALIGGEACVPALADLLARPETVGLACLALANNPTPKAEAALLAALQALEGNPRVQVINTLAHRRAANAVAPLTALISATDPASAAAAVLALGRIATPPALKQLATLRQQRGPELTDAVSAASLLAAETLVTGGQRGQGAKIYQELLQSTGLVAQFRRGAFEALLRLDRDGGQQRILETLAGTESELKPSAIAAIPQVKAPNASPRFAAVRTQLPAPEQVLLLQALAARNDPGARTALEQALGAPEAPVRLAAIRALGTSGNAATVPVLARSLASSSSSEETKTYELALSALGGGSAVDQALVRQWRDADANSQNTLLAALVRRANPTAVPTFVAVAASSEPATARLAFHGLSRAARPTEMQTVVEALTRLQASEVRATAEAAVGQALSRAGDVAGNSALLRRALAQATSREAQGSLIRLLAVAPDTLALAAVKAALNDADPQIQNTARRTLADWPDPAAWDSLATVYASARVEPERVVALRGLVRLLGEQNSQPQPQLIGRYRDLIASAQSDDDRKLVLSALAGWAHPSALELAVAQLSSSGVRAEAEAAVKRIAQSIKADHPQAAEAALQRLGSAER